MSTERVYSDAEVDLCIVYFDHRGLHYEADMLRSLMRERQARAAIDSRGYVSQGALVAEAVPVDVASIREVISEMLEVSVGIFEDWADKLSRAIGDTP